MKTKGFLLDGGLLCGRSGRRVEEDAFADIEAAAAEELVDDRFGEARGVEFDADGFFGLVELELADSVDLAEATDAEGCGF